MLFATLSLLTSALCAAPTQVVTARADVLDPESSTVSEAELSAPTAPELVSQLDQLPAVHIDGDSYPKSIRLRGLTGAQTLVTLDGVPLNNPASVSNSYDASLLDKSLLESAEVVTGSQSVLAGPGAVGGVLKLRTRSALAQKTATARGELGTSQHRRVQATAGYGTDTAGLLGQGQFSKIGTGSLKHKDSGQRQSDDFRATSGTAKASVKSDAHQLDLFTQTQQQDLKLNDYTTTLIASDQSHSRTRAGVHQARLTSHLNADHTVTTQASLTQNRYRARGQRAFNSAGDRRFFKVQAESYQDWQYGLSHQSESIKTHSQETYGGFVHYALPLPEAWTAGVGARYDYHSLWRSETNYAASLAYDFGSWEVFGNFGTGFRPPSLNEIHGTHFQIANKDLKPERSRSYDLGVIQDWTPDIQTKLTGFLIDVKNLIRADRLSPTTYQAQNLDKKRSTGLEAEILYTPGDFWTFKTTYTYTHVDCDDKISLRTPRHKLAQAVKYDKDPYGAEVVARYTSDFQDFNGKVKEDFDIYCGASYKIRQNTRTYVRLQNALNRRTDRIKGYARRGTTALIGLEISAF